MSTSDLSLSSLKDIPPFPTDNRPARVSVVFNGERNPRLADVLPDIIICSSDHVYFAIHSQQVTLTSKNKFAGLLTANTLGTPTAPTQLTLAEPCVVLNSLFRTMYGLSADEHPLDLDSISATLKALGKYGMTPLELHVFEVTCLYSAAMAEARNQPFETYGVAAQYSLEDLAVALSACTILHSPYSMSIELGERMGVPYLHRLYLLHGGRDQAIRAMFHIEPADHATKSYCSDIQQQQNRMEFSNACALMVWDAPDISHHIIKACMNKVAENTRCPDCKTAFIVVTEKILTEWDNLQTTI